MSRVLVRTTRGLFFTTAAVWLLAAGLIVLGIISLGPVQPAMKMAVVGLMVIAAAGMVFLGARCLKGNSLLDWTALAAAGVNILLTFTDQVGPVDLAYLVFSLGLLGTLGLALILQRRDHHAEQSGLRAQ